jgi:hypothetical protein
VIEAMDTSCAHQERPHGSCGTIPELERLCYFFGQMLEPADFRAEQAYFTTLLALLGRHTAGWGVACGLDVGVSTGQPEGCEDQPAHELLELEVTPGVALDCCGRLVVLRKRSACWLWELMDKATRDAFLDGRPVYVSIEYVERPVRPSKAAGEAWCDPMAAPQYGRIRDETRLRVSLEPPEHQACDACLDRCPDPAVLLAVVRWPAKDGPVSVRNQVRRPLGRHHLATVTDLGWVHGGTYGRRATERLLTTGVGLRFSRPVQAATLADGVVDLVVYEGGGGRREAWYFKEVELERRPASQELVGEVVVKAAQPEGFQERDRILLRVRCDFVLDECCRAVSGAHLGGGVPFDPALSSGEVTHPTPAALPCPAPPDRSGPWRSGNGVEGGVFESWIFVGPDEGRDPGRYGDETSGSTP